MNTTLREFLQMADDTHMYIEKYGMALRDSILEERIRQLKINIKNIQSVAKRMADISNIANEMLLKRKRPGGMIQIDPHPTSNDHAVLRTTDPESKAIIGDIKIPVRCVDSLAEIPVSHVYYVRNIKQYAVNISGVNFKGSLSNIIDPTKQPLDRTSRCEYGIHCRNFSKRQTCKYYHEPEDYIKLGFEVPDDCCQNYTVGSWLYSRNKNSHAYFARHIGSRDSLLNDLRSLRGLQYREEIANREGQFIHDLLILQIVHSAGMLERYPHWNKK